MKNITIILLAALLLAGCVAAPAGPGSDVITPKPTEPVPGAESQGAGSTPAGSEPTATAPMVTGPIVSTAVAASTVDLRTLQTPTPEPLPATSADVTVGKRNYGESVTLTLGQTLAIVLDNKNWEAPAFDTAVLRPLPWPGAVPAGMQAWLFQAAAAGTTLITMQTPTPQCPDGGPCPERPTFLFELTVTVTP